MDGETEAETVCPKVHLQEITGWGFEARFLKDRVRKGGVLGFEPILK